MYSLTCPSSGQEDEYMFKLLITKENICGFEIALLAFLSVLPLINISNTGIEQLALSITLGCFY